MRLRGFPAAAAPLSPSLILPPVSGRGKSAHCPSRPPKGGRSQCDFFGDKIVAQQHSGEELQGIKEKREEEVGGVGAGGGGGNW